MTDPNTARQAMSEIAYTPRKCTTHDPYWETVYGNCMACRAENAEQQLAAMTRERDDAVDMREGAYMRIDGVQQQLAASQARCREMEAVRHDYKATLTDAELSDKEYMTAYCSDFHADYGLALKRLAQLQATLAAREARIRELEDQWEARNEGA